MSHGALEQGARGLVAGLAPGRSSELFHLLTCPECRDWAVARLLSERELPEEDLRDYGPVWRRLEERAPVLIEEARRRRGETERLYLELLAEPPKRRLAVLSEPRFHRAELLDRLLADGRAALATAPAQATELARLAVALAPRVARQGVASPMAGRVQALCLAAEARRLAGELHRAKYELERAAGFVGGPAERALYCRTLALLYWDQGRLEEAAALLEHAVKILIDDGPPAEEAVCVALLGLLHLERQEGCRALESLLDARVGLDARARPALAVRVELTLALALANLEQPEKARLARDAARGRYDALQSEDQRLRARWLDGRVTARLGETDAALGLLEPVVAQLLDQDNPAEAALAAVDVAATLAAAGRSAEIAGRIAETRRASASALGLEAAVKALDHLAALDGKAGEALRERASCLGIALRQTLRLRGFRAEPPPAA